MTRHAQQLVIRYAKTADADDREPDRLARVLEFSGDPALASCYTLAGWAMACLGPVFWICIAYLLLVAEFG